MKTLLIVTIAGLALAGCTTPYWSQHLGEVKSYDQARQTINRTPAAQAPAQTEGQIVNAAQDRYHNSYGKPQAPANVYKIGVGTGSGK